MKDYCASPSNGAGLAKSDHADQIRKSQELVDLSSYLFLNHLFRLLCIFIIPLRWSGGDGCSSRIAPASHRTSTAEVRSMRIARCNGVFPSLSCPLIMALLSLQCLTRTLRSRSRWSSEYKSRCRIGNIESIQTIVKICVVVEKDDIRASTGLLSQIVVS